MNLMRSCRREERRCMGKAMQDQMDTKTQNSQIYIGTPNGIVLCADEGSGHSLRGRFYHAYSRDAIYFENADQLIFEMEQFFDSIHFPHPGTRIRSFDMDDKKTPGTAGNGGGAADVKNTSDQNQQTQKTGNYRQNIIPFGKREKVMKDQELLSKHGDLGSFIIRVQQRQNSSMQGRLTWIEKNKTVHFRSVWELIRLIDSAVEMDNPVPEEEIPSWED